MEAITGTIGYGVVGSGYFGAELARIMNTKPGAQIRAVYDPENGGPVAAELGCDAEDSLESLVSRKDIQAVIVATPNYLHKEPVLAAAGHGLHVFCEKPIALSFEDCREIVDACRENHVVFMAGHVMNFFRQRNSSDRVLSGTFFTVTGHATHGKEPVRQKPGKRHDPNQEGTCTTISMSWTASSSLWGAVLKQ